MGQRTNGALQSNVLILNRLYTVVHVVSARRAFCLHCKGVAEVVNVEDGSYMAYDFKSWLEVSALKADIDGRQDGEDWIRAVNFEVQVPRVIRLLHYDRVPKNEIKFNRRNIFLRDDYRCQYCGSRFSSHNLSLDHIVPRSRGGRTNWENIITACLRCNVRKGGRTPKEAGMKLLRRPKKPRRNPVLLQQLSNRKYACWRNFLE